ncbi:MAG TPA: T9SS type A sorting domain-containing protein, partial [Bacteroidia bacterium]|nr:T9SS type A sorting domain-containing protein [Bacteroidia bacterium]
FTGPYTLKWTPSASVTSPDSAFTYAHPKTTTTYTVSAVTPCGTVSDTVTITVIVAGINTISSPLNNMSVSPNPANGLFAVNYNLLKDENIEMSVIDEFGRIVFEKQLKGQHAGVSKQVIDLTNLPQGIYSLRMIADEGISVKKVVIVKN